MKMIHKSSATELSDNCYNGSADWSRSKNKSLILDLSKDTPRLINPKADPEYAHLYQSENISKDTASRDGLVEMLGEEHRDAIGSVMIRNVDGIDKDLQLQAPHADTMQEHANFGFGMGIAGELSFDIFILNEDGSFELFGLGLSPVMMSMDGVKCFKNGQLTEEGVEMNLNDDSLSALHRYLRSMGPRGLRDWLKKTLVNGFGGDDWTNADTVVKDKPIIIGSLHCVKMTAEGCRQTSMSQVNPRIVPHIRQHYAPAPGAATQASFGIMSWLRSIVLKVMSFFYYIATSIVTFAKRVVGWDDSSSLQKAQRQPNTAQDFNSASRIANRPEEAGQGPDSNNSLRRP